jgi:hypothetical protein
MATYVAQQHERELYSVGYWQWCMTFELVDFLDFFLIIGMCAFQGQEWFPNSGLIPLKQMSLHSYYFHWISIILLYTTYSKNWQFGFNYSVSNPEVSHRWCVFKLYGEVNSVKNTTINIWLIYWQWKNYMFRPIVAIFRFWQLSC